MATATHTLALFGAVAAGFGVIRHAAICHPLRNAAVGVVQTKGVGLVLAAFFGPFLTVVTVDYVPAAIAFFKGLIRNVGVLA